VIASASHHFTQPSCAQLPKCPQALDSREQGYESGESVNVSITGVVNLQRHSVQIDSGDDARLLPTPTHWRVRVVYWRPFHAAQVHVAAAAMGLHR